MEEAFFKVIQTLLTIVGTLIAFVIYSNKKSKAESAMPGKFNGYAKESSIIALQKSVDELEKSNDTVDRIVSDLNKDAATIIAELHEIKLLEIEELKVTKEVRERLNLFGVAFEADMKSVHEKLELLKDIDKQTRGN